MAVSKALSEFLSTLALAYLQTALLWTIYEELRLVFTKLANDR